MGVGGQATKSKSEGKMPKDMRKIIKEGWEEMGDLREMLIGQFMGILSGEGPYKREMVGGSPGYYETRSVRTGAAEGEGGGQDIYEDRQVWVPGTPGKEEWVPSGEAGVQIPIIAQAQEQQRRAASQAMRGTQEEMARTGLAGTPFGEMIEAQQRQQGASAVQGVGTDIITQMLGMIPGYTQGSASSVMGALPGTRETESKSSGYSAWGQARG